MGRGASRGGRRRVVRFAFLFLVAFAVQAETPSPLKSGIEFLPAEMKRLQADDFANPGMLWVSRGEKLFQQECASCHGAEKMKGVAATYPKMVEGKLTDLAGRINLCRAQRQKADPYAAESEPILALTAFVTHQSRGVPIAAKSDPALTPYLERGRSLYHQRVGQMNLACTHCHDRNWGRRLAAETISQGHPTGFPAYRLSWESLGSIARRIRACYYGVRAEMPEYGAPELLELELYLTARAAGLPLESPAVRR